MRVALVTLAFIACAHARPTPATCTTTDDAYASILASGYDRESLAHEREEMRTHIPRSVGARSQATADELASAVKYQEDKRWLEAARGFRAVALDDTADKPSREVAQWYLALDYQALGLFTEARAIFEDVAAEPDHPNRDTARGWLDPACR